MGLTLTDGKTSKTKRKSQIMCAGGSAAVAHPAIF
eukprot:COSAG01_NODE_26_length_36857_cov_31.426166_19_plen_35_part_00